LGQS